MENASVPFKPSPLSPEKGTDAFIVRQLQHAMRVLRIGLDPHHLRKRDERNYGGVTEDASVPFRLGPFREPGAKWRGQLALRRTSSTASGCLAITASSTRVGASG